MGGMKELEEQVNHAYWIDLGLTNYADVCNLQVRLAELRNNGNIPDVILCTQHNPVISFGGAFKHNGFSPEFLDEVKRLNGDCSIAMIQRHLNREGIHFYPADIEHVHGRDNYKLHFDSGTSRGGGSTYIGPGQLVIYPIVNYKKIVNDGSISSPEYKQLIDRIMYETLSEFYSIPAQIFNVLDVLPDIDHDEERKDRKDIWVEKNRKYYKIGSKSVHFSKDVAYHGFSLFVNKKGIQGFDKVLVCGYTRDQLDVTSMEHETGEELDIDEVKRAALSKIQEHFNYDDLIETTINFFSAMFCINQIMPEES